MNLLLDTQALVWWHEGHRKLGPRARKAIETHATRVHVSIASVWEIAIKVRRGLLRLREPCHVWVHAAIDTSGFQVLAVAVDHAVDFASLPDHHPDPFDRMLIVQARAEGLTIVTSDTAFDDYDVKVLDARA